MIELKAGDVFATDLGGTLGTLIKAGERVHSQDAQAFYSHAGVILDWEGTTFEALWTVKRQNLWKAYAGANVIIARWKAMNDIAFERGFRVIQTQEGKIYPVHRLFLHALDVAKLHIGTRKVCSELTSCFQMMAGMITQAGGNCYGVTPDNLIDEWRISKYVDIIYEGKI